MNIPDAKTEGYLLRQEQTIDLQIAYLDAQEFVTKAQASFERAQKNGKDPDFALLKKAFTQFKTAINAQVDYILGYVVAPDNIEIARKEIKNLSEDDLSTVLERIREGELSDKDTNPTA